MNIPISSAHLPVRANETRDLVHPIRRALNLMVGVRVVRNNTGSLEWAHGKRLVYGLGIGSPDLVGIVMIESCTRPIVEERGPVFEFRQIGRAFALEVKRPGRKPRIEQERWMSAMRKFGGFAAIVHSVEEAQDAVVRCRNGGVL